MRADEPAETKHAAKAEASEPSQAHSEDSAQVEAPHTRRYRCARRGSGCGRWRCYSIRGSYCFFGYVLGSGPERTQRVAHCRRRAGYPTSQPVSPLVPSETQLAEGNLVLTEAQVAQRLAPVVEHLFGENGTAKDATTVLIRVRALGSYYDALTHVRRNGFWEQARTFELIPETLLDIPALKTDSYSEGEGSPLAMSLTFTPGVPVQAAFDYANEQAFVSYPRPLDAERYVEELRMFPRLGSKIPAHMTSALSHWNL